MSTNSATPHLFTSADVGAPTLNNEGTSLLEIIRAIGITGYNARVVTSIAVTSGVAVATAASHGYTTQIGHLVLIEGAPEAALNGRKQPLTASTNSFSFAAPDVPDGIYTGTMSAKRAPIGLVELHTGADRAVFGRAAPQASSLLLRVVDAPGQHARAQMLEAASDVDTFTGASPGVSGGFFWCKGANTTTPKSWVVVGNERGFYLFTQRSTGTLLVPGWFMDAVSVGPGDPWACSVAGAADTASFYVNNHAFKNVVYPGGVNWSGAAPAAYPVLARASSGAPGPVATAFFAPFDSQPIALGDASRLPAVGDMVPIVSRVPMVEHNSTQYPPVRGHMPGLAYPAAASPFLHLEQVADSTSGRVYVSLACDRLSSFTPAAATIMVDVTGPWHD
jgi:hypothetical protein